MTIVGAETIMHSIHTFRSVWIRGRYGGGKTFLAFLLAQMLHKKFKYGVYSNIENTVAEPYYATQADLEREKLPNIKAGDLWRNVVVYDEAWMSLGAGTSPKDLKAYLVFLRKRDLILLMPSVLPIDKRGYLLWIERKWNLGPLGLPLWIYDWGIAGKSAKESGGKFFVFNPQKYFGMYDTYCQPDELGGLFDVGA